MFYFQAAYFAIAAGSLNDKHAVLRTMQFVHSQLNIVNSLSKACNRSVVQKPAAQISLHLQTEAARNAIANFGNLVLEQNDDAPSTSNQNNTNQQGAKSSITATPPNESQRPVQNQQFLSQLMAPYALMDQVQPQPQISPGQQRPLNPQAPRSMATVNQYGRQIQIRPTMVPSMANQMPPNIYVQQQQQQHQHQMMGYMAIHPQQQRPVQQRMAVPPRPPPLGMACAQMNRLGSPPMASSPSGVSSTTVTPTNGHYGNHHLGFGG